MAELVDATDLIHKIIKVVIGRKGNIKNIYLLSIN